jgi:hypothetical protein
MVTEEKEVNQIMLEKMLATTRSIIETIEIKDRAYGSSWKSHGGFSAFFNLDRKYSRVQNMAKDSDWDIFTAMALNPTDGPDALRDLIAYALLILSETYDPPGWDEGEPGKEYVDQDGGN